MTTALHLDSPHPAALTEPNAGTALPPPPGLRIVCVDDNADAADSLGTLLDLVGCDVLVAHDAPSALERADAFRPEVWILDICLNEAHWDGCKLARAIRERPGGDGVLLVALTALGHYQAIQDIADAGFDLYFTKPVAPHELYAALNRFAEEGRPRV